MAANLKWAIETAEKKKKICCSDVEFMTVEEGICVQIMHIGYYDDELESVEKIFRFIDENGYENDFGDDRMHYEIYLSDPRRCSPEKLKTVIRHPIKKL